MQRSSEGIKAKELNIKSTTDHLIFSLLHLSSFILLPQLSVFFFLFFLYLGWCRIRPLLALVDCLCWARKDMAWLEGPSRSPETF